MERLLAKLARQLMTCDEASLMSLWNAYALKVQEFEPTKEWEEATIAFCMIQAIAFKNQLFNYNLASEYSPLDSTQMPSFFSNWPKGASAKTQPGGEEQTKQAAKKRATLLQFPSHDT